MSYVSELTNWKFYIDSLNYSSDVTVPHTWNVTKEVMKYRGECRYETTFIPEKSLQDKVAVLTFNAVYHTAKVYLNGAYIGEHSRSGYTPFSFDITSKIAFGKENILTVIVDNTHVDEMLPHDNDFDWADDGGIIRKVFIEYFSQKSVHFANVHQVIKNIKGNKCSGYLYFKTNYEGEYEVSILDLKESVVCLKQTIKNEQKFEFNDLNLWSTDNPYLYLISIKTENDELVTKIGLRKIETKGEKVFLNDQEIFLKGCEWMPGSLPECGMAEPFEHSKFRLKQLKEMGCNFTRFHWQQDDAIFDWCDENGLLVQEEIPYWGQPKKVGALQIDIAQQQAREMIHYHFNHPSIIFWGVGNELGGELPETIDYVKNMVAFIKDIDETRLVNYVSNSLSRVENIDKDDATLYGDIVMWNDYLGLWEPTDDVIGHMNRTCLKAKGHPVVVSEFGLCEPQFSGGDERRCKIIKERLQLYKHIKNIIGYVWFSLNDYRTHCGEAGEDNYRRRVHGSTDLYGNKKPSFDLFTKLNKKF